MKKIETMSETGGLSKANRLKMIKMSERYNVICKETSFIAIDEGIIKSYNPMQYQRISTRLLHGLNLNSSQPPINFLNKSISLFECCENRTSPIVNINENQYSVNDLKKNRLIKLFSYQKASGEWISHDELLRFIDKTQHDFDQLKNCLYEQTFINQGLTEAQILSMMVLFWLKNEYREHENLWTLIYKKTSNWLLKNGIDLQQIIDNPIVFGLVKVMFASI